MNLLQLKNRVIQKLKERSTPTHWTVDEIVENLNAGCLQIARDTDARMGSIPLRVSDPSCGTFLFPSNVLSFSSIFWNGLKLDRTSADFLDSYYKENTNDFSIGNKEAMSSDWRSVSGTPEKWLLDSGLIRLYPIPSEYIISGKLREKVTGTILAGTKDIAISDLPSDKSYIDVFLNGVYQNQHEWTADTTGITLSADVPVSMEYEVVYTPTTMTGTKSRKVTLEYTTGAEYINLPFLFEVGSNALTVTINGVVQSSASFSEITDRRIKLASALTSDSEIEITIIERCSIGQAYIRGSLIPQAMISDTDEPDLPNTYIAFHDAIWCWALAECYSRESQEKDMAMVQLYMQRYGDLIRAYKVLYSEPLEITPRDSWRV